MGLAPGVFSLEVCTAGTGPVAKLLAGLSMASSVMPWGLRGCGLGVVIASDGTLDLESAPNHRRSTMFKNALGHLLSRDRH